MGLKAFFSNIRAAWDGDRSPFGSFWFEPVGVRTSSGVRVTSESAYQLSAVFACVRIVSSQFASLPFRLYKNRPDGGKDRVTNHPVYTLLAKRPNQYQNAFEWREMMAGHLCLRGNAFNQIVSNARGQITALIPLHPDRMKIEMLDNQNYRYRYSNLDGSIQYFTRGQIWHIRGISSDGIVGLSPIALARSSFGGALAAQDYAARFFANDAKPSGGWIEFPGNFTDKQKREQFRESFQDAQSAMNRGKVAILEHGMKYHEVGITNDDAQFLETRKFNVTDIARWFGVPPHKIGDLDRATFSNIEQQAQEFIQECLGPMAERWEASIEADLLFDDEGVEPEFDFAQLLRGDSVARTAYYNGGINGGWLTRNEARIRENLNPLPGLDAPLLPLNMQEESATSNQNARLAAIIEVNAKRLARRFVKSGVSSEDVKVISESLGVSHEEAAKFCGLLDGVDFMDEDESTLSDMLARLSQRHKGS